MAGFKTPDGTEFNVSVQEVLSLFGRWRGPVLRACGCPPREEIELIRSELSLREEESHYLGEKIVVSRTLTRMLNLIGLYHRRALLYLEWSGECEGQITKARRFLRSIQREVGEIEVEVKKLSIRGIRERVRGIRERSAKLCSCLEDANAWLMSDLRGHERKEEVARWLWRLYALDDAHPHPSTEELKVALQEIPKHLLE